MTFFPLGNSCNVGTAAGGSLNLTSSAITETVITSDNTSPAFKVEPSPQESVYPYQVRNCSFILLEILFSLLSSLSTLLDFSSILLLFTH